MHLKLLLLPISFLWIHCSAELADMNVSDLYIWHNQFSIRLQGPTLYSSIAAVYYTVPHTRIYCCANVLVLVVRHALCPLIVHKLSVQTAKRSLYIHEAWCVPRQQLLSPKICEHGSGRKRCPKSNRSGNMKECCALISSLASAMDIWLKAFLMPPIPVVLRPSFLFLLLPRLIWWWR